MRVCVCACVLYARSLCERGGRRAFVRDKGLAHTHNSKEMEKKQGEKSKEILTNSKKGFEHIELPAKLLEDFLRRKRGGGLGSSTIFKKFHEPYAPS